MWFEQLEKEVQDANPAEGISALFAIMYYYFAATCFMGLIWLLWKVLELRIAIACNLSLLAVVFVLMLFIINGLRRTKSWARILLIINYSGLIMGAVAGLIVTFQTLMVELTSAGMIALSIYLLIILMCGYGGYLLFIPTAKKINWC